MLSEDEVRERAKYCYLVFLQLSWLHSNDDIPPEKYIERLRESSLQLGADEFIVMTIEEALMESMSDAGLLSLMPLFEGFAHAFCEVLETTVDEIKRDIPNDLLVKLAEEMGVKPNIPEEGQQR